MKKLHRQRIASVDSRTIYYQAHKSLIIFLWPCVWSVVFLCCIRLDSVLALLSLVSGVIALTQWGRAWITYYFFVLQVTDQHLIIKKGFLRKRRLEYLLLHLTGIEVEKNLIGLMLNYGDILLYVSGQRQTVLGSIGRPHVFQQHVDERIKQVFMQLHQSSSDGSKDRQWSETPGLMYKKVV